jgi:hypothetical protein
MTPNATTIRTSPPHSLHSRSPQPPHSQIAASTRQSAATALDSQLARQFAHRALNNLAGYLDDHTKPGSLPCRALARSNRCTAELVGPDPYRVRIAMFVVGRSVSLSYRLVAIR